MLTRPIDQESAKDEKIKELESTIKDREKAIAGLETLLSESRAEVEKLTFSVPKLRAAPASFMFYTGLSVESFGDILYLVGAHCAYSPDLQAGHAIWQQRVLSLIMLLDLGDPQPGVWS